MKRINWSMVTNVLVVAVLLFTLNRQAPEPLPLVLDPSIQSISFEAQRARSATYQCDLGPNQNGIPTWFTCMLRAAVATLTPSPVPPAPSASPSPTLVQEMTPTVPPVDTPTPSGELIDPFASAPLCTDGNGDGHPDVTDNADFGAHPDNELWHDLWNEVSGCHYDHEHGDNPDLGNLYFGEPGALWGGQTIAYPFTSGDIENHLAPHGKHNGFKWHVRTPAYHALPACGVREANDILVNRSDFCIVAVRAQIHLLGAMDFLTRYHSGFVEVYACKSPYQQQNCGTFKMGSSLIDWGQPRAPFYQVFRPRPFPSYGQSTFSVDFGDGIGNGMVMNGLLTDSINFPDLPSQSGEPYINVQPESPNALAFFRSQVPSSENTPPMETWSSNDYDCEPRPPGDPCHNPYFHMFITIADSWFLLDTTDMRDIDFVCQPGQPCYYNSTLTGLNEIGVRVLPAWDTRDGTADGYVTWSGYTDRFGNPREGCTAAGRDCVPFELVHAPVGVGQKSSDINCLCSSWEHDIHFDGEPSGWVKFPN